MITLIELENFRGFSKHRIPLREISVIVGRNNSGKSTIIEALRLVSIVVARARHATFVPPPTWLRIPNAGRGISPSLRGYGFEFSNLCHQYSEPDIFLHPDLQRKLYRLVENPKAREIVNRSWDTYDGMISICSGKKIVSRLSKWAQENYGVSFSALTIAREIKLSEISPEVIHIVTAIEQSSDFPL